MTSMIVLDTVLRLIAVGQLLLIALVVGRGLAPSSVRLAIIFLLVSVGAYLANASPFLEGRKGPLWAPMLVAAQFAPLALWLFAHLLFERRIIRAAAVAAAAMAAAAGMTFVVAGLTGQPAPAWAPVMQHLLSLALLIHALFIALRDRGNDLVEKRRRFRIGFVLVVGLQALAVVLVEMLLGADPVVPALFLTQSAIASMATAGFGALMLTSDAELLAGPAVSAPGPLSASEHVLNERLEAVMAEGIYREPGLTIGALAGRLAVPEHRLRSLINQRLGYRNFSDFLNRHRIAEAKTLLADPAQVDIPVLTIAMDLGYGSLAPFNRAFREATSQTPTDFRRAAILGK